MLHIFSSFLGRNVDAWLGDLFFSIPMDLFKQAFVLDTMPA
jgi:hypothetical protein